MVIATKNVIFQPTTTSQVTLTYLLRYHNPPRVLQLHSNWCEQRLHLSFFLHPFGHRLIFLVTSSVKSTVVLSVIRPHLLILLTSVQLL